MSDSEVPNDLPASTESQDQPIGGTMTPDGHMAGYKGYYAVHPEEIVPLTPVMKNLVALMDTIDKEIAADNLILGEND